MNDNEKLIESLLERTIEYGKTSLELVKLKTLDKTSEVVSSFIPHSIVFFFIASLLFFLNLGLAFWLGEIMGNNSYGFFVVAGFYGLLGLVIHFFMHDWLKKKICNYIIKQVLK
jgi:fatty acid desaturase